MGEWGKGFIPLISSYKQLSVSYVFWSVYPQEKFCWDLDGPQNVGEEKNLWPSRKRTGCPICS
jgi:hypothetical protein